MKWTIKNELARKFVHILTIFILLVYFIVSDWFSRQIALLILVLILIVFLEFEYLRLEVGREIPILNKIWKIVRRDKEKDRLGGDIFFLVGAILVLSVFDLRIAIAAILMTTLGDLSASLIGRCGKHQLGFLKDRTWEGVFAELVVDLVIGVLVFFVDWSSFSFVFSWSLLIVVLVMVVVATVIETIVYKMDDNLLIPIFSGFAGQVALLILR